MVSMDAEFLLIGSRCESQGRWLEIQKCRGVLTMWFAKSQEEVLTELAVDPATGLSSEEAQRGWTSTGETNLE